MNMSEKAIQKKIIKDLKAQGYWVMKTQGGVAGTPIGTPDIIACDDIGNFLAIEVKKIDGKLSDEQILQLNKLSNNMAGVYATNDADFGRNISKNENIEDCVIPKFNSKKTYRFYQSTVYEVTYD